MDSLVLEEHFAAWFAALNVRWIHHSRKVVYELKSNDFFTQDLSRIIWLSVFAMSVVASTAFMKELLDKYQKSPIVLTMDGREHRVQDVSMILEYNL